MIHVSTGLRFVIHREVQQLVQLLWGIVARELVPGIVWVMGRVLRQNPAGMDVSMGLKFAIHRELQQFVQPPVGIGERGLVPGIV